MRPLCKTFRAIKCAVPLKEAVLKGVRGGGPVIPRYQMRGPIEGYRSERTGCRSVIIPRYQMRGPIEGVVCRCLKATLRHIPRYQMRGPIEGWLR